MWLLYCFLVSYLKVRKIVKDFWSTLERKNPIISLLSRPLFRREAKPFELSCPLHQHPTPTHVYSYHCLSIFGIAINAFQFSELADLRIRACNDNLSWVGSVFP